MHHQTLSEASPTAWTLLHYGQHMTFILTVKNRQNNGNCRFYYRSKSQFDKQKGASATVVVRGTIAKSLSMFDKQSSTLVLHVLN